MAIEIRKVSGGNTVDIADQVNAAVAELNRTLPGGVKLKMIQDNSVWIRHSVDDVQKTLVEGAILTVLIVFLFLNSWRSTVITGLTLPVSVISSFFTFYAFGFTLNMMTLMALSLVIGILIDDAIVVRENIVRHVEHGEDHMDGGAQGHGRDRLRRDGDDAVHRVRCSCPWRSWAASSAGSSSSSASSSRSPCSCRCSCRSRWTRCCRRAGTTRMAEGDAHARAGRARPEALQRLVRGRGPALPRRHRAGRCAIASLTLGIAVLSFVIALALPVLGAVGGEFMPRSDEGQTSVAFETPVGSSHRVHRAKGREIVG